MKQNINHIFPLEVKQCISSTRGVWYQCSNINDYNCGRLYSSVLHIIYGRGWFSWTRRGVQSVHPRLQGGTIGPLVVKQGANFGKVTLWGCKNRGLFSFSFTFLDLPAVPWFVACRQQYYGKRSCPITSPSAVSLEPLGRFDPKKFKNDFSDMFIDVYYEIIEVIGALKNRNTSRHLETLRSTYGKLRTSHTFLCVIRY